MSNEDFVVVTGGESESYPEDESGFSERTSYSRDRNATTSDTRTDSGHKEEEHEDPSGAKAVSLSNQEDHGWIDERRLIELLKDKLQDPVEDFVSKIEGLPNKIPENVTQGFQTLFSKEKNLSLIPLIEVRVDSILNGYRGVLKERQGEIGLPVFLWTTSLTAFFCSIIVGMTLYVTPSFKDIQKEEKILANLKRSEARMPHVVVYKGIPYVQIAPGTTTQLKDKTGVHFYARLQIEK
jgi:hypothetical protein